VTHFYNILHDEFGSVFFKKVLHRGLIVKTISSRLIYSSEMFIQWLNYICRN